MTFPSDSVGPSRDGEEPRPRLILLVDDDLRTVQRMAQMLREDGFAVDVAVDGATAIGRLTRPPVPDVLVTDLRMPYADGLAVARFGRTLRPSLPVFVVTGYPNLLTATEFDEPLPILMTKPVDYEELRDEIARALDRTDGTPSTSSSPPRAAR